MISVSEAKAIIAKSIQPLHPVELPLADAAGHVLAQDVFAALDIPPFEQSSMDGYAIRYSDRGLPLTIRGEVVAGANKQITMGQGEAARIFTGAALPNGTDTVVMQEKITLENENLFLRDNQLKLGQYVRHKGSEIKTGGLALQKNSFLSPAAIGFMAEIGVAKIEVYPMPSVSIIITGNELQQPPNVLNPGQVYEANSFSLRAALKQYGVTRIEIAHVQDDLAKLNAVMAKALAVGDIVLLTGGVSVGDYDFVVQAAEYCGVQQKFHKVKQRPGKPLYFGMIETKVVLGLPGNPASVLSCFYNYVLPALDLLTSKKRGLQKLNARITGDYNKQIGLTHFLKGFYKNGEVEPLPAQESFRLSSFAKANCLICLEEERDNYCTGETVEVYLLPS